MSGDVTRITEWAKEFTDPKVLIEVLKKNVELNYLAIF